MSDPDRIYLQPECCADPQWNRLWCEDNIDDCDEGEPWVEYVNKNLVDQLYDAIAHGDEDHRAWLKEVIENHFNGLPVPPPRGKGTDENLKQIGQISRIIP